MSEIRYRDCVALAAKFLELDEAWEALTGGASSFLGELGRTIDTLVTCVDLVLNEIACDYVPLKKREEIKSNNCRIYFKDLTRNVVDFYSVAKAKKEVKFVSFHDCILLPCDDEYEVTYSYTPLKGTLETKLEWDGQRVNERVVAYGVACEYGLMNGLIDDAALWDKRFKDALFKASIVKNERVVKRRKWI